MGSDDRLKQTEEERKRMLEAIRRRSEEAELKRLEDEEKSAPIGPPPSAVPAPPEEPPPASFIPPAPPPATPPPPEPPPPREFSPFRVPESLSSPISEENAQRALILKEKFLIAIDRGKAGKAGEILSELNLILPPEEILALGERLKGLEAQALRAREKKWREEPPPLESQPEERPRPRTEGQRKKIAELLENVNGSYQQEKYTAALEGIAEILRIDAENEEALRLKEEILRARQLAEQIAVEDEKRRREEAAALKASGRSDSLPGKAPTGPGGDKDFWGSSLAASNDLGIEMMPEEKGPVAPPKPPLLDRIAGRVVRVKIPMRPLLIGLGAIAAIALAYVIIDNIRNAVAPPLYSVLVLPPAVGTADSSLISIAEGLAVDLAQDLSTVSDLRVVAPTTAFELDASSMGNLQRCRAVSSNHYVRWSLARQGEFLALQADLYDTASAKPLWSSNKVSAVEELARVKTEMARALVMAMKIEMSMEEQQLLTAVPTSNEYAYMSYLRARSMERHPDQYPVNAVIRALEQAIVSDSLFGRAHAALGWAHVSAYERGDRAPAHLAEARTRVQRSLSLVLRNPEAYKVWGALEVLQGQHDKAIERFEEAVAIAPSDVEAQSRLALAYASRNKLNDAVKAATRAVIDDPWNNAPYIILGQIQQFAAVAAGDNREDYAVALRTYQKGMKFAADRAEYGSTHIADVLLVTQQSDRALGVMTDRLARARQSHQDLYILGRVQQSAGRPKQEWQETFRRAEEILQGIVAAHPDDAVALSQLALVHTRLGEFREAVASIQQALKFAPGDPAVLYNAARMYALQVDKQQAKEVLRKAVDRYYSLPDILDYDLFPLHAEPDFVKIVTR